MKNRQGAISKYLSGELDLQAEACLVLLLTYQWDTKTPEELGTGYVSALLLQPPQLSLPAQESKGQRSVLLRDWVTLFPNISDSGGSLASGLQDPSQDQK